jgi:hypothetical protein
MSKTFWIVAAVVAAVVIVSRKTAPAPQLFSPQTGQATWPVWATPEGDNG